MRKVGIFTIRDLVLLALACAVLGASAGVYVASGYGTPGGVSSDAMSSHPDFDDFWHASRALLDGRNIYHETGGPSSSDNPPLWAVLTSPLALLEPLTAYRIFVVIMALISVGYLGWMANELDLRGWRAAVGAGTLFLSARMLGVLVLGQLHPLVGLGLVAAWIAGRRGRTSLYGCALGLVVAIKPLVIPVLLLPLVRRQWKTLGIAIVSGLAVTIVGVLVAGPASMLDWLDVLNAKRLNGFWDNASIHGAAARIFTENEYVEPIAELPGVEVVAYFLGVGILILTALRARWDPEMGLWALVAAGLLASPIGWWTYFVLFGPGILLLLARGQIPLALLLLSLQFIPPEWSAPWRYGDTVTAPFALTLNLCVLIVYWLAFFLSTNKQAPFAEEKR